MWVVSAALVVAVGADAQTTAWCGGGGYDGYDRSLALQPVGIPYADNAAGATNVLPASAWLNGMLASTGAAPTAVSVYWGITDGTNNKTAWTHTNEFGFQAEGAMLTTNVTGLAPHTVYYYRFYATNTAGEESWAHTTTNFLTPEAPAIAASGASAVDAFSAELGGTLTAGIEAAVIVFWGSDPNAWSGTNALGTRPEGSFTSAVSGLTPTTAYYYRGFASNTAGSAWSEVVPFTTLAVAQPVITATGASAVDASAVVLNGTLTEGGGAAIVIYWGTNSSAWSVTNDLGNRAAGAFSIPLSGLSAATPYAYRCYASNTVGTAWSGIASFTTRPAPSRFSGGAYDGFDAMNSVLQIRSGSGVIILIR